MRIKKDPLCRKGAIADRSSRTPDSCPSVSAFSSRRAFAIALCAVRSALSGRPRSHSAWRSNPADYIEEFRHGLATYEEMRCGLQLGLFHGMLAQLLLAAGDPAEAAKEAETALAKATVNGERWWAPEIHRTLGDALLALPNPDEAAAESCYVRAIAEARHTGGLMLELRAATSLARTMVRRGDEAEARRMLAPIFTQFNEGLDSVDLRAAQVFLVQKPQAAAS